MDDEVLVQRYFRGALCAHLCIPASGCVPLFSPSAPHQSLPLPCPALPPSILPSSSIPDGVSLRLNKHITKLKYLQVPLISIQPLFQSVSQWDSVSRLSWGRTCIDALLNKAGCGCFVYVCYITIFSCKTLQLTRPGVKPDLAAVMINAKSKVTGIPAARALPGDLLTLYWISMHIADSLSCTKKTWGFVPNDS